MIRKRTGTLLTIVALLLATSALAQEGSAPPEMTPEQMAEMEAYMKAGTPGAPHETMASTVGSYDLKITSWHEPGGPPTEETGTATRQMTLDGRVLVEDLGRWVLGGADDGDAAEPGQASQRGEQRSADLLAVAAGSQHRLGCVR